MQIFVDPDGFVVFANQRFTCALGKGGIATHKREGDGVTPAGEFALGRVFYRADRLESAPETKLQTQAIRLDMGWCDDPTHADYNQLIALPHPARHERLWRKDHLYDLIIEILYNTDPIQAGRGSAIFLHVAKPHYTLTQGCIALKREDLLELLRCCTNGDSLFIPHPEQA